MFLGVDLGAQVDHLAMIVLIHQNAAILVILMNDGEAVGHFDVAALSNVSHQSTDTTVGVFGATGEGVADGQDDLGMHADTTVRLISHDIEGLEVMTHGLFLSKTLEVVLLKVGHDVVGILAIGDHFEILLELDHFFRFSRLITTLITSTNY